MTYHCPLCGCKLVTIYGTSKKCKNGHAWRIVVDEEDCLILREIKAKEEEGSPEGLIL